MIPFYDRRLGLRFGWNRYVFICFVTVMCLWGVPSILTAQDAKVNGIEERSAKENLGNHIQLAGDLNLANPDSSILLATQALNIFEHITPPIVGLEKDSLEGLIRYRLGLAALNNEDYKQSIEQLNDWESIAIRINDSVGYGNAKHLLGRAYLGLGQNREALDAFQQAVDIRLKIGLPEKAALSHTWMASCYKQPPNLDSQLFHHQMAMGLYKQIDDTTRIGSSANQMAIIYRRMGESDSAYLYYQHAVEIQEMQKDTTALLMTLGNLALLEKRRGRIPEALAYHHRVQTMSELSGNKSAEARVLNSIGLIHLSQGDVPSALNFFRKALSLYRALGHDYGCGSTYSNIGIAHKTQNLPDSAIHSFEQSMKFAEKSKSDRLISYSINNLAFMLGEKGEYDEAIRLFEKTLELRRKSGTIDDVATSLGNIGRLYVEKGQITRGIKYLEQAMEHCLQVDETELRQRLSELLSEAYEAGGQYKAALHYYKDFVLLRDSLNNESTQRATAQREARYEYEKKKALDDALHEKQLDLEKKEKEKQEIIIYAIIGVLVLVSLFLLFVFNRLRLTRKQKEEIETQHKIIAEEKQRSESLLLNILPEETAAELKSHGFSDARHIEMVTVLFTDFKSFTQYSQNLPPQQIVEELHACFSEFDKIVEKYGVEKIKTIGDAYMAAGGLPTPNHTNAHDVVKAALEMQEFIQAFAQSKRSTGQNYPDMRLGVHTGPVVAGIVGIKKFQYDIWGDTVNTASRMESHGEVNKVNISRATYEIIKDNPEFRFEERRSMQVKGKGEIDMYHVFLVGEAPSN